MRGELVVRNQQRRCRVHLPTLRRLTRHLLTDWFQLHDFEVGVYLVDSQQITRLNETYVGHDGATDIITFDYSEHRSPGDPWHGELIICVEEALRQAERYRIPWHEELIRYLIHGMLHLQGYDDTTPPARRRMKRAETRILKGVARDWALQRLDPRTDHGPPNAPHSQ